MRNSTSRVRWSMDSVGRGGSPRDSAQSRMLSGFQTDGAAMAVVGWGGECVDVSSVRWNGLFLAAARGCRFDDGC